MYKIVLETNAVISVENCSTAPHAGREMRMHNVLFGCRETAGKREKIGEEYYKV